MYLLFIPSYKYKYRTTMIYLLNTRVEFGTNNFFLQGFIVESFKIFMDWGSVSFQEPRVSLIRVGPPMVQRYIFWLGSGNWVQICRVIWKLYNGSSMSILFGLFYWFVFNDWFFLPYFNFGFDFFLHRLLIFVWKLNFSLPSQKPWLLNPRCRMLSRFIFFIPRIVPCGRMYPVRVV